MQQNPALHSDDWYLMDKRTALVEQAIIDLKQNICKMEEEHREWKRWAQKESHENRVFFRWAMSIFILINGGIFTLLAHVAGWF